MDTNTRSITETASPPVHLDMEISVDALEQFMIEEEREIARHRANQIAALELLDRAQAATADGSRNLSEWVAARVDLGHQTSKSLVRTMRRIEQRPELRAALESGEVTFDRIDAASRIDSPGLDPFFHHLDVSGVRREAANRARLDANDEHRTFADRYLVIQPTLDESCWRLWGGLDGVTGAIVDKALGEAADQLPIEPDSPFARDTAWRRATALAQLCVSDEPPPTQITVFVDGDHALGTDGESGLYLEAGPRVGREALAGLMCEAVTEVTVTSDQGEAMRYGRSSRTIPPALRRAILHRDGNRCVIDGCDSRNRLQIHHVVPWSRGGPTNPENLITVCWYHHHIAIHQHQLDLYRHPEHGRYRLRPTSRPPPG